MINPAILKGQIHGGIAQGAGQVLMEQVAYDRDSGQLLSGSFMDYAMPRADDFCSIEVGSPFGADRAQSAGSEGGRRGRAQWVRCRWS